MANNLFISYDLKNGHSRDYKPVFTAIHNLGDAIHLELSQYFVSSDMSAQAAAEAVWKSMEAGDKLLVADTKNNEAYWYGVTQKTSDFIKGHWSI